MKKHLILLLSVCFTLSATAQNDLSASVEWQKEFEHHKKTDNKFTLSHQGKVYCIDKHKDYSLSVFSAYGELEQRIPFNNTFKGVDIGIFDAYFNQGQLYVYGTARNNNLNTLIVIASTVDLNSLKFNDDHKVIAEFNIGKPLYALPYSSIRIARSKDLSKTCVYRQTAQKPKDNAEMQFYMLDTDLNPVWSLNHTFKDYTTVQLDLQKSFVSNKGELFISTGTLSIKEGRMELAYGTGDYDANLMYINEKGEDLSIVSVKHRGHALQHFHMNLEDGKQAKIVGVASDIKGENVEGLYFADFNTGTKNIENLKVEDLPDDFFLQDLDENSYKLISKELKSDKYPAKNHLAVYDYFKEDDGDWILILDPRFTLITENSYGVRTISSYYEDHCIINMTENGSFNWYAWMRKKSVTDEKRDHGSFTLSKDLAKGEYRFLYNVHYLLLHPKKPKWVTLSDFDKNGVTIASKVDSKGNVSSTQLYDAHKGKSTLCTSCSIALSPEQFFIFGGNFKDAKSGIVTLD